MKYIIGNPFINGNLRNTFCIRVHFSHGDADHYTTGEVKIEEHLIDETFALLVSAGNYINCKRLVDDVINNIEVDIADTINALSKEFLKEYPYPIDFIFNVMEYDVTDLYSCFACIDSIKLVWYDDNGIPHIVYKDDNKTEMQMYLR